MVHEASAWAALAGAVSSSEDMGAGCQVHCFYVPWGSRLMGAGLSVVTQD